MRRSLIVLSAAIAFTVTATGVLADDINPPSWRDNNNPITNRSTWQWWEFGDASNSNVPPEDGYVNPPLGVPGAAISSPAIWTSGVWSLSGGAHMALFIPNYSDGPEKQIWIQLTWKPEQQGAEPIFSLIAVPPPTLVDESMLTETSLTDGWVHGTYLIVVQPNPLVETIDIMGDISVDEVVVDTICPEPATMLLLGLAVPFVLKRRGRR